MTKFIESNDHPNANNSHFFGAGIFLFFILMNVLGWIFKPSVFGLDGFIILDSIGLILSIVSGAINLKNKFETNDSWKTLLGVAAFIYNFFAIGIYIKAY